MKKNLIKIARKLIANPNEYEYKFYSKPKFQFFKSDRKTDNTVTLVGTYGERWDRNEDESDSMPLKVYVWFSRFNGYINGTSTDPDFSKDYNYFREKGLKPDKPFNKEEKMHFSSAINVAKKSISSSIKMWKRFM